MVAIYFLYGGFGTLDWWGVDRADGTHANGMDLKLWIVPGQHDGPDAQVVWWGDESDCYLEASVLLTGLPAPCLAATPAGPPNIDWGNVLA